ESVKQWKTAQVALRRFLPGTGGLDGFADPLHAGGFFHAAGGPLHPAAHLAGFPHPPPPGAGAGAAHQPGAQGETRQTPRQLAQHGSVSSFGTVVAAPAPRGRRAHAAPARPAGPVGRPQRVPAAIVCPAGCRMLPPAAESGSCRSMTPPPTTKSPSYHTTACPGLMARWGSMRRVMISPFSPG